MPEPESFANSTTDPLRCAASVLADGTYEVANADLPLHPPDSGDFHETFTLSDGSIAVVMGDVVGHGAEAARHAGTLSRAIGECLQEGLPPSEALGFVNAAAEMSPDFEGFATVFAGKVVPETGTMVYASGGHESGLIATDTAKASVRELDTTGPPLGVLGADETGYEQHTVTLEEGSTLLLYTDGISESRRGAEILGIERLRRFLGRWQHLKPLSLAKKMVGYARAFTGKGRKLRDDAALLVLRRRRRRAEG